MIDKVSGPVWRVGEMLFTNIESAQEHELAGLFCDGGSDSPTALQFAQAILKNKTQVLNILTLRRSSHPKARKANGAARKPKVKVKPASPQTTLPLVGDPEAA